MGYQIYRFEIIEEIGRDDGNVIYRARDTADASEVKLYEWAPPSPRVSEASATLAEVIGELRDGEVFSSGLRLYLAASEQQGKPELELLRSRGLFTGSWPGVIEEALPVVMPEAEVKRPEPPPPAPTLTHETPSEVEPKSPAPLILALCGLGLLLIIWIVTFVRMQAISRERDSSRSEIQGLISEKNDLQSKVDSLNAELKQKDEQLAKFHEDQTKNADRLFRAAENSAQATMPHSSLKLENECSKGAIDVVVYYQSLQSGWVTRGWYRVKSGETGEPDVYSKDGVFYLYAQDNAGGEWRGEQGPDLVSVDVVDQPFTHRQGEALEGAGKRTVPMFKRETPLGTSLRVPFTCP